MIIDDRIFKELEEIEFNEEKNDDLLYRIAQEDLDKKIEEAPEDWDEDDAEEYLDDFYDYRAVYRIPNGSLLEYALFTYGKAQKYGDLFDTFDKLGLTVIDDEAYLITGYGYDVIDMDLLGGDGSGSTKRIFLKIINENN